MSPPSPPLIGLTGGIAAGKSAVAKILGDLGCVVARSDEEGRAALRDPLVRQTLIAWWGEEILDADGEVDRARIAEIVFTDPEQRERLEGLTHPWIALRRDELFDAAPRETPALVIDAPLLFETGLDEECDTILFIDAARSIRRERVERTRGWDARELSRREESQLPLDVKRSRADYVLRNEGELSELAAQVRTILSRIVEDCQR